MSDHVPNFAQNIASDTRYFPALAAVLVIVVMLLFFDKLTEPLKTRFVPSLVAYAMGASLLGYVQTMLNIRRQSILNSWQFWTIVFFHALWFASFIGYNFWRGSIP
jgi:hypothetical protein